MVRVYQQFFVASKYYPPHKKLALLGMVFTLGLTGMCDIQVGEQMGEQFRKLLKTSSK